MNDPSQGLVLMGFDGVIVDNVSTHMRTIEGMRGVISTLAEEYTLMVVCHSHTDYMREHLEHEALLPHFKGIFGKDLGNDRLKLISTILRMCNRTANRSIFVTHNYRDIINAQHLGIASIAAVWPETRASWRFEASPDAVVTQPEQLVPVIHRLLPEKARAFN
jgi:phosphoglycolate phosphatase-like HAD superfamily hydrolase